MAWSKNELLTGSSLISIHVFLGIALREIYLESNIRNEILAPWILRINHLPTLEMAAFLTVYIGILQCAKFAYGNKVNYHKKYFLTTQNIENISEKALWICIFSALTFYFIAIIATFGSVSQFIAILSLRTSSEVAGFGYYSISLDLAIVSSVFLYTTHRLKKSRFNKVVAIHAMLIAIIVIVALQSGRGNLIQYLITLLIIRHLTERSIKSQWKLYLAMPIIVSIITIVGLSNRLAAQNNISYDDAQSQVENNLTANILAPFALVDHYMIAKEFTKVKGHDYGTQYLTRLLTPIPREFWKEKPVGYGLQIRQTFWGDSLGGIPPGYIGESYIAFGLPGVWVAAIILAILSFRLDSWFKSAMHREDILIGYALITPFVAFYMIRGGIELAFMRITIIVLCFLFIKKVTTIKNTRNTTI